MCIAFVQFPRERIEKDVVRTDRDLDCFADAEGAMVKSLENLLMSYVFFNFDVGYVQGMGDLLRCPTSSFYVI